MDGKDLGSGESSPRIDRERFLLIGAREGRTAKLGTGGLFTGAFGILKAERNDSCKYFQSVPVPPLPCVDKVPFSVSRHMKGILNSIKT